MVRRRRRRRRFSEFIAAIAIAAIAVVERCAAWNLPAARAHSSMPLSTARALLAFLLITIRRQCTCISWDPLHFNFRQQHEHAVGPSLNSAY